MTRKFTFLMTAMALIFAIIGPRNVAWGQSTATSHFLSSKTTNAQVVEADKPITYQCSASNSYENPARIYKGNNFTVASTDGSLITKIEITSPSGNPASDFTANIGNYSATSTSGTWTGSATTIIFTASGGQVRVSDLVVTYGSSNTLESITIKAAPTKLTYTEGETFDPAGLVITKHFVEDDAEDEDVAYSQATASQFSFGPSLTTALTTSDYEVTITYGGKSTTQAITVNAGGGGGNMTLFYESFNTNDGTGGNDDKWSGNIASNDLKSDNEGWTFVKGNGANKCAKFGSGSAQGSATTPSISYNGNATLTFKAAAWDGNNEGTTLNISATNATLSPASVTLAKGAWTEYSINITNVTNSTQITFEAKNASNNRFFLDEVKVLEAEAPSVATPTFNPAAGTYTEAQSVTITCATGGATIYYTIDGTNPTDESTRYTSAITVSETKTIKAIAYSQTGETSSVASATYTIAAPLTTMDAIFAKATAVGATATDVTVTFNNWVISGVKGNNAYLTDGTKGLIIYENGHGFTVGDKLTGTAACKVQLYNGAAELTTLKSETTGLTVTKDGVVSPVTMAIDQITSGIFTGAVITIENVTYNSSDELLSDGTNTIKPYDKLYSDMSFENGKRYNVTGVYLQYGTTKEIMPRDADDIYPIPATEYTISFDETQDGGEIFLPTTTASAGTEIQISATAYEGYKFTNWIINPSVEFINETTSADEVAYFTMPASNVTISAEFELIPTVSYYFIENGIYSDEIEATEGTYITLPESNDINDFTFAGWTTDESDVDNILAAGSEYTIADDVIFYAVYAKEESGETTTPDAYTAGEEGSFVIATLVEGIYYAIPTNPTVNNGKITGVAIETERANNVTYVSTENANGYTWTITDATYGQTLSDGSKYLYHSNGGDSGTNLSYGNSTSYTWNITTETVINNEVLKFQAMNSSDSDNSRGLLASTNDNETKFGGYSLSNSSTSGYSRIVVLPIATNSSTTHYYTRVFQEGDVVYEIYGPSIIPSGVTLSTSSLINTNPANLIIEDGAQLIQYNEETPTAATVRKNITGYTSNEGGYNLITTPIVDGSAVSTVQNGTYDLYRFNQAADLEWENVKAHPTDFTTLNNGTGYLYANSADVTLEFVGDLKQCGLSEPIYPELPEEDYVFRGFNLIGNPFACNATIWASDGGYDAFYILEGDEFTAVDQTYEIKPCEAIFVEACVYEGEDDYVLPIQFITKQQSKGNDSHRNSMNITVSQNESQVIDRAIVSFGGISNLHKFMLNPSHTNISLAKNGETFAAISSETEGEIPVNFKAEKNGTYTITVNTENLDAEYLHLIDNMTGMDTDLLSTPSYTFSAKTSDYASRFKLVFNVKDEASASSANDFAYMSDGNLVINNIEGEATLQIVDMMGRVLSTETVSDSYNKALNLRAGVYVLNLNGMTQKIVVR